MNDFTPHKCPRCGTEQPAGSSGGVCPRCAAGLLQATQTDIPGESTAFTPPTVAELAAKFPQLEIIELIGRGGMGAVYKARQRVLDRTVALKILPPDIGKDAAFAERFAREAKALAKLNHPGIVTIYDFGRADGLYFFLMEFVDGMNLRELLNHSRISAREALAIVPQICDALQFAHDLGIVHRDIKPENLLMDRRGRVKVADFGLAKLVGTEPEPATATGTTGESPALTEAGKVMGTPNYMSPEQVEHPGEVDHRADIYALGVVFYQMLTGELPDKQLQPPSRKVQIDVRLDEVVLRALEKQPDRRYQQASVLKTQVETIASGPAGAAAPVMPAWYQGMDYKSKATLFGLPLVHVTSGLNPATGRVRVSRGIIAIGGIAQGVLAFGGVAMGGITFGGLSLGIFSLGGLAIGLLAFGGIGLALLAALGGLAVAPVALGGLAVGIFARGGLAVGLHTMDAMRKDPVAVNFFGHWAGSLFDHYQIINVIMIGLALTVGVGLPQWLRRRINRLSRPPAPGDKIAGGSPLAREISEHMTENEKWAYHKLGRNYGIWNAVTFFLPFACIMLIPLPVPLNWIIASTILLVGLAFYPVWWQRLATQLCATEWAKKQGCQPESVRIFRWGSTGLMLLGVAWLVLAGFAWWQTYRPDGVWLPWLSTASIAEPSPGRSACVTAVRQVGQTVVLHVTCDPVPSSAMLAPAYIGPLIELPYQLPAETTNVDCLVTTAPHSVGRVLAGTNDLRGKTNWVIGFVLPDEQAAAAAVKQIRKLNLGRLHGWESPLFVVRRTLGKDPAGNPLAEEVFAYLQLEKRSVIARTPVATPHPVKTAGIPLKTGTGELKIAGTGQLLEFTGTAQTLTADSSMQKSALNASALQIRRVVDDANVTEPADTMTNFVGQGNIQVLPVSREVLMDGNAVEKAGWGVNAQGYTEIVLGLTEAGSREFAALTATNINHRLAIIFQRRVLCAPTIRDRIETRRLPVTFEGQQKDLLRTVRDLNRMKHPVPNLKFGPEQESLLAPMVNRLVYLNLRANRLITNSQGDLEARGFHEWQRENGADLAAMAEESMPLLQGYDLTALRAGTNHFNDISPAEICYNADLLMKEPQPQSTLGKDPHTGGDTYYFRTRDDTWGVLEVIGFAENPRGVKIRYKVVQP